MKKCFLVVLVLLSANLCFAQTRRLGTTEVNQGRMISGSGTISAINAEQSRQIPQTQSIERGIMSAIVQFPDLTIQSIRVLPVPKNGDKVGSIDFAIKNIGKVDSSKTTLKIDCTRPDNKCACQCPASLREVVLSVPQISPNSVEVISSRPKTDEIWQPGWYRVIARVNTDKLFKEADTGNNTNSIDINIAERAIKNPSDSSSIKTQVPAINNIRQETIPTAAVKKNSKAEQVSVQAGKISPMVQFLTPSEGAAWETSGTYEISWNSALMSAGSYGRVEIGCTPYNSDSPAEGLGHSLWCLQFTKIIKDNIKPQGTVNFRVMDSSQLSKDLKIGDLIDLQLRVSFYNKSDGAEYSDERAIKLKIVEPKAASLDLSKSSGIQEGTVNMAAKVSKKSSGQVENQIAKVSPSVQIVSPVEDSILESGNTYDVEWSSLLMPAGIKGKITFSCGFPPDGNLSMMDCVKAQRIVAENIEPQGKVTFKVPNRAYWAQNVGYGKIVNMSFYISFYDNNKNIQYNDLRKIKVKIIK